MKRAILLIWKRVWPWLALIAVAYVLAKKIVR
jgi:hypothetical protein